MIVLHSVLEIGSIILITLLICSCVSDDGPIVMKTKDDHETCSMNLNACEVKMDIPLKSIQGPRGEQGVKGPKGETGDKGSKGMDGSKGEPGQKGEDGLNGNKGEKGDRGPFGPPGVPGMDAVCAMKCSLTYDSDEEQKGPEGTDFIIGTLEKPSDYPCNVQRDEEKGFEGKTWINPKQPFQVQCMGPPTQHTCLIIDSKDTKFIEDNSYISTADQTENIWLSNYFNSSTKQRFNLTQFYNDVKMQQIDWLRDKTRQITQTIRYHCKNSYLMESEETALHLYSRNDVTIGPTPTEHNPMAYTILPDDKHECTTSAPKTEWRYSDITVRGSTERLPIIDFHIRDNRKEEQRFFVEVVKLCFS